MPVRIIGEIGSCHMGKWELAKEHIDMCARLKMDAVKFQLFPNHPSFTDSGNVWLDPEMYLDLLALAHDKNIKMGASCFDEESFEFLLSTKSDFIKLAYSQKHQDAWIRTSLDNHFETLVSCDVMSRRKIPAAAVKLFCLPFYPVYFQVKFDELFPMFYGFSDHTLGFDQTLEAVFSGANMIEKHITLNTSKYPEITCPDSHFALQPFELAAMVASIRKIEKDGIL